MRPSKLLKPNADLSAIKVDDLILCIGGDYQECESYDYNMQTQKPKHFATLNEKRVKPGLILAGDYVYAFNNQENN